MNISHIENIFLLHNPQYPERLIFQKKQLKKIETQLTVVNPIFFQESNGFQNKAIKSCYASHMHILKKIYLHYNKPCLILEDDIVFYESIRNINIYINYVMFNHNWDFIFFHKPLPGDNIKKYDKNVCYVSGITNAHAYVVSPKILKQVYTTLEDFFSKIDKSTKKLTWESHIDYIMKKHIHPLYNVIAPNINLINQNRKKFGSTLGWGYNDSLLTID